jgi:protein SERAC1
LQTWANEDPNILWPRDLLPPEVPTARVLAFGYDAKVANISEIVSMERVREHAMSLLKAVADDRETDVAKASDAVGIAYQGFAMSWSSYQ